MLFDNILLCYALLSLTVENKQAGTSLVQNVQDFIACTYLVPENLAGYTRAFHWIANTE